LWAEVRQRERFSPSFSLVRRYWVSAATLDGLFVACCTWAILLYLVDKPESVDVTLTGPTYAALRGWLPSVATTIGALFCLREAGRYESHQREELVATLLHGYDLPDRELSEMLPDQPAPQQQPAPNSGGSGDPSR